MMDLLLKSMFFFVINFHCTEATIALIIGWSISMLWWEMFFMFLGFLISIYFDSTEAAMDLSLDAPYDALL